MLAQTASRNGGQSTTDDSGRATVTFKADSVSEPVTLVIATSHGDSVTKHWTVGVPGLVSVYGAHLHLVGATTAHPNSHFIVQAMLDTLNVVADSFYALYSSDLQVNDASLAYGGFLDLDTHWGADSTVHLEHRLGRSADIDDLTSEQRHQLKRLWEKKGSYQFVHVESSHYHLRFWR